MQLSSLPIRISHPPSPHLPTLPRSHSLNFAIKLSCTRTRSFTVKRFFEGEIGQVLGSKNKRLFMIQSKSNFQVPIQTRCILPIEICKPIGFCDRLSIELRELCTIERELIILNDDLIYKLLTMFIMLIN